MLIFCKINADISKIKEVLVLKGIFSEANMCMYLHTKFQVFSVLLTIFRQLEGRGEGEGKEGGGRTFNLPTPKQTPKQSTRLSVNLSKRYVYM